MTVICAAVRSAEAGKTKRKLGRSEKLAERAIFPLTPRKSIRRVRMGHQRRPSHMSFQRPYNRYIAWTTKFHLVRNSGILDAHADSCTKVCLKVTASFHTRSQHTREGLGTELTVFVTPRGRDGRASYRSLLDYIRSAKLAS